MQQEEEEERRRREESERRIKEEEERIKLLREEEERERKRREESERRLKEEETRIRILRQEEEERILRIKVEEEHLIKVEMDNNKDDTHANGNDDRCKNTVAGEVGRGGREGEASPRGGRTECSNCKVTFGKLLPNNHLMHLLYFIFGEVFYQ